MRFLRTYSFMEPHPHRLVDVWISVSSAILLVRYILVKDIERVVLNVRQKGSDKVHDEARHIASPTKSVTNGTVQDDPEPLVLDRYLHAGHIFNPCSFGLGALRSSRRRC